MANTIIQLKHSTVTGNVPVSLANGEISINNRDGKLFYSTPAGVVTEFSAAVGPSGLDTEVQFNDAGNAGANAGLTFDKTSGVLTVGGGVIASGVNLTSKLSSAFDQANTALDSGTSSGIYANAAFDQANSKTYIFEQNTAPTTSNVADRWVNIDTGFEYHNFGNTTHPIWAEVGPTGVLPNTEPGVVTGTIVYSSGVNLLQFSNAAFIQANAAYAQVNTTQTYATASFQHANAAFEYANTAITTSGGTITGQLNVAYTPATPTGYGLTISSANTQGGVGYADFLKVTNNSAGATANSKSFRLTSGGGIEIVNSEYTSTIFGLSDTGNLSVSGDIQVNGKKVVNGPAFSAYAAAILQTIPTGVQTKVLFQTEEYDTNSNYTNSRFTPTVEGYYQLNAEVRLDGTSGTGEMMIILYKNGTEYKRGTNQSGTQIASNFWAMTVSSVAYANGTGDYFEIYVQQGSGGDRTVTAVNNTAITWFNGCMIRGA